MPRQARVKSHSKIYHIILRGANRQEIFHDEEDCMRFLDILGKNKRKAGMDVYAWCLMNNHVHLLLKEGDESISITMKRIGVSYVRYYNWKYGTTGHLFQDRFKSENVETVRYLLVVVRYIHQNPVKAGIAKRVDEWKWSSCRSYYGQPISSVKYLLDGDYILSLLSANKEAATERFKGLNERRNNDQCLDEPGKTRLTDVEARQLMKELLGTLEIAKVKSLSRLERDGILRKVKQINGISQRQIARILGISPNLVFKA
ncbi:transposase [Anaerobacillus sp. CMMVII]|uniref:transposase n=1 Tax=Anaerobacillus sp. CMMVII TaxID=2755588 RepID=UPI0021B71F3D|nr:transposase [Anaerobacillus sp. CMMVII]MCT8137640.1 transposase [Anaerobacillus sp. CMMVII]